MELHHQAEAAVKIAAVIVRRRLSAYYPGRISTVTAIFPARIFKILCGFFRPEFSYIFFLQPQSPLSSIVNTRCSLPPPIDWLKDWLTVALLFGHFDESYTCCSSRSVGTRITISDKSERRLSAKK